MYLSRLRQPHWISESKMKSLKNTLHQKTRESLDFALGPTLGGSHASPNLPRVSIHLKIPMFSVDHLVNYVVAQLEYPYLFCQKTCYINRINYFAVDV